MKKIISGDEVKALSLYPNSWVYLYKVSGFTVIKEDFFQLKNLKITESSAAIDYGGNCFGGVSLKVDELGKKFLFLGQNHWNRLRRSGEETLVCNFEGEKGLSRIFMPYNYFENVCLKLNEKNQNEFKNEHFNYFRPVLISDRKEYGVTHLSDSYTMLILCMKLEEGEYDKSVGFTSLFMVDPNIVSRPGHVSEATRAKGGSNTYSKGATAALIAKEKGYTDAIISCYDRDSNNHIFLDCSSRNLALVKGKIIIVPKLKERTLFGITIQACLKGLELKGWKIIFQDLEFEDFKEADFVCTFGTAAGVNLVTRVGDWTGRVIDYKNTYHFDEIKSIYYGLVAKGTTHIPGLKTF